MIYVAGSTALAAVNLAGLILIARKRRWGWLVLLASDVAALPYQYMTLQYGFLVTGVAGGGIAVRAFASWGRQPGKRRGRWRVWPRPRSRRRTLLAALTGPRACGNVPAGS